jgi:catechol 2,3-dioxygenase-like lactoylglutathione lyase family enzyme
MRFAHVNVIAQDWRLLARFYQTVFGCRPVPPERDQCGAWLDRATGVVDAHIQRVHLRLPGDDEGPTLEVYSYEAMPPRPDIRANTPGFSHIAFVVDDLRRVVDRVVAEGGTEIGQRSDVEVSGVGHLTFQYVADPEGNIIEVQHWS